MSLENMFGSTVRKTKGMKVPQVITAPLLLTTDNLHSTLTLADIDIENVEIVVEAKSTMQFYPSYQGGREELKGLK